MKCQACFALRNLASDGRYAYKNFIKNMNFKVLCTYYTRLQMCSIYYGMVYTLDINTKIIYLKVLGVQSLHYIFYFKRSVKLKISYGGYFTDENQLLAVETGALPPLHHILTSCRSETLAAAAACLRNLSIHKLNEVCFLSMYQMDL